MRCLTCQVERTGRWSGLVTVIAGAVVAAVALVGCGNEPLREQPRYDVYEASELFRNGTSARPLVEGVVPRRERSAVAGYETGRTAEGWLPDVPLPITMDLLERGRERYEVYCSPCHSRVGDGLGMIVLRGFTQPPSYHTDRLRQAPAGHFFDVMTNGFGTMEPYDHLVPVDDRWAIVAYIRALQRSQYAMLDDVPEPQRSSLVQQSSPAERLPPAERLERQP